MSLFGRLSGVLNSCISAAVREHAERWWDAFLDFWGLFNPEFRRRWLGEQRELLDADMVGLDGGNFDGAGTGGQD